MRRIFENAAEYGPERIINDPSFILPTTIIPLSGLALWQLNITVYSKELLDNLIAISTSLIAVILTGLAVIVSIADESFLALLKELEIYLSLMFMFQYNIYLSIFITVFGVAVQAAGAQGPIFYIYLSLYGHFLYSLTDFVDFLVEIGDKQAEFSRKKAR